MISTTKDNIHTNLNYFNRKAHVWDNSLKKSDHDAVERIIQITGISSGDMILDIGTGTGITIPYYLKAGVHRYYSCRQFI